MTSFGSVARALPARGLCEHCFDNECIGYGTAGQMYTCKGLIVNDCRLDDRFKDRPYVTEEPGVRFYAGVPITTREGYMIGVYAVSDEKPRNGLNVDELRFMEEMARVVMEHLEWARDRVDRFKGERIVRGMASFIEECSSSSEPAPSAEQENGELRSAKPAMIRQRSHRRQSNTMRGAEAGDTSDTPSRAQLRTDGVSKIFQRAAKTLRESTLADGVAIFSAAADHTSQVPSTSAVASNGVAGAVDGVSPSLEGPTLGSDSNPYETSDSDMGPSGKPCELLAYSLLENTARADLEQPSALTVEVLEKYFHLFPDGKAFSLSGKGSEGFPEEGNANGNKSERPSSPSTNSDGAEAPGTARVRGRECVGDHKELMRAIPSAESVVFLPLYDHAEERLVAGCFLWTSTKERIMNLDDDLLYLRAFGNSLMSELMRLEVQKNEAAKTTFIASMSHELRSPLHGILGAAEFLMDTASDSFQSGLVSSTVTCGKTLLDTLNHVLDYSKINKLGHTQMRENAKQHTGTSLASESSLESLNMSAEIDLSLLVEEVVEAITAGHAFKQLPMSVMTAKPASSTKIDADQVMHATGPSGDVQDPERELRSTVLVLLDISSRRSWMVRTQPGALRRIIMNLLGNALKYTSSGFVAVSLRAQEKNGSTKIETLIRIVDSGKGISEAFQRDRLFLPFNQEDSFQPGIGLGLSIVGQIVDSLGGSIDVRSQQQMGTAVDVHLSLAPALNNTKHAADEALLRAARQTEGLHMIFLDPAAPEDVRLPRSRLEETLRVICTSWFGMRVSKSTEIDQSEANVLLYSEPPAVERILERHKGRERTSLPRLEIPIIIVCMSAAKALEISRDQGKQLSELGRIVEVISQPFGPRKLAKVLTRCLERRREMAGKDLEPSPDTRASNTKYQQHYAGDLPQTRSEEEPATQSSPPFGHEPHAPTERSRIAEDLSKSLSSAVAFPSPPPINPATPWLQAKDLPPTSADETPSNSSLHILLVDDNKINLKLLVMFMKKHDFSFAEAENGREALDQFKNACLPSPNSDDVRKRFDFVLMDINMPVMNGIESTRRIRDFEYENNLPRTSIIALTGLANEQAQKEAKAAGIDVFLPKPVEFAELKKLLTSKS